MSSVTPTQPFSSQSIPALISALTDPDVQMRRNATIVLTWLAGGYDAFEALLAGVLRKPPLGTQRSAPQLRVYALKAAKRMAKAGLVKNPEERLESLVPRVERKWQSRLREVIKEIRRSPWSGNTP